MSKEINNLDKLIKQNKKNVNSYINFSVNKIIKSYRDIKKYKPKNNNERKEKKNKLNILIKNAKIKINLLKCIKNIKKDDNKKYKSFKEIKTACEDENKYLNKYRKRRKIIKDKGLIIQESIIKVDETTLFSTAINDEYLSYIDTNFRKMLNRAHKAIWKNNKFKNVSIKILYGYQLEDGYITPLTNPPIKKPFKLGIKYTAMSEDFGKNIDPLSDEEGDNYLKISLENVESDTQFILLGYMISYSNKKGGYELPKKTINELKAYKPISDRKYHELTTASTTDSKICIYESFLDIANIKELKYMRHNKENKDIIINMLKNEGEAIYNSVVKGHLLLSLELLTKKYNNKIIVCFYNRNNNIKIDEPFMVDNGELKLLNLEDLNNYIGVKGFLYYKEHVAPFQIKEYDNIKNKKINKKFFSLTPEKLKIKKYEIEKIKETGEEKTLKEIEEEEENKQIEDEKIKNILGYDSESYRLEDGTSVLYNITLYGKLNNEIIEKSFYGIYCLNKFIKYLNEISTKKDNKKARPKEAINDIYIYGFNNSNFDNLLIYEKLYEEDQSTEYIFTNNAIKRIKYNNLIFLDMRLYYSGSLKKVAEAFKIDTHKGVFPYDFVHKKNIYYIGEHPEEKFFNKGDYEIYKKEYMSESNIFIMKDYTEKYCLLDSKMVYEIAVKHLNENIGFIKILENKKITKSFFNSQGCATGAGIAINIFKHVFLNYKLDESPEKVLEHEKLRYKGGRTEVFKKEFNNPNKKLHYFDINSSYPSSMTEEMPYKYINTVKYSKNKILELDEVIKFNGYYCKIEYKGDNKFYIPNILTRTKEGDIIATNNTDFSWHWGVEVIEAIKNGCEVIYNEIERYEPKEIFKQYSQYFYNERLKIKETNESKATFYKLLLNSLYGKFGQKRFTHKEIVNNSEEMYNILGQNDKLINWQLINNKIMVEYETTGDEFQIGKLTRFSSYISAVSRSKLSEIMRDIGHEHIYYCDTDSIFTDKKPNNKYIDSNILGKWKEETKTPIKKAIFLAPKTYYYCCENGKTDQKAKGVKASELTVENYEMLMNKELLKFGQKNNMFFRSFNGIKINPTIRHISTVYNKRIWGDNDSKAFKNIEEWRNTKIYKKNYNIVIKELNKKNYKKIYKDNFNKVIKELKN